MRMWVLAGAVVIGFVLYSGSLSASQAKPKGGPAASTPAVVVKMTGDAITFDPRRIEIKRGQTIEWDNNARVIHTVTADPKQAADKQHVQLPPRAKPFDSGYMKPGQTFRHRFTVPGTYRYVCLTHEVQGMVGEVVVK